MIVWKTKTSLADGTLPVPLTSIPIDWWGQPVDPAPGFALIEDPGHLWLLASHPGPLRTHPGAGLGEFVEGLWEFDVAECFIAGPQGYLEFNLSPTGAWWWARFSAPRVRNDGMPRPQVICRVGKTSINGGRMAALGIPLADLRHETGWPAESRINVSMILGKPQQFLSVANLGAGEPDFHRPEAFETIDLQDI